MQPFPSEASLEVKKLMIASLLAILMLEIPIMLQKNNPQYSSLKPQHPTSPSQSANISHKFIYIRSKIKL
jgi:hypothetical protein